MVLRLTYSIDRSGALYSQTSELEQKDVESHLREVISTLIKVREMRWPLSELFVVDGKFTEKVDSLLEEEITYCLFWGYLKKRMAELDYMKWVFMKKEEDRNPSSWMRPKGDRWTMSNGRVKAVIEIEEGGPMTKLALFYNDDCGKLDGEFLPEDIKTTLGERSLGWNVPNLHFLGKWEIEGDVAHLKNANSIAERIQSMKNRATHYMEHHIFPIPTKEASNLERLKKLLWIE